jgi:hypothetical protein
VFRSSAFDDDALHVRIADRGAGAPAFRFTYVGVRLVRAL